MGKEEIYIEFGKRLSQLRAKRGLTQAEVADSLNMAQSTYAGYETAARKVRMEAIVSFANFYGVDADYLIKGEYIESQSSVIATYDKESLIVAEAYYKEASPRIRNIVRCALELPELKKETQDAKIDEQNEAYKIAARGGTNEIALNKEACNTMAEAVKISRKKDLNDNGNVF